MRTIKKIAGWCIIVFVGILIIWLLVLMQQANPKTFYTFLAVGAIAFLLIKAIMWVMD